MCVIACVCFRGPWRACRHRRSCTFALLARLTRLAPPVTQAGLATKHSHGCRGRGIPGMDSFPNVMLLLFRTFLGETMFDTISDETDTLYVVYGTIVILLYAIAAAVVLANLLIALISSHFQPELVSVCVPACVHLVPARTEPGPPKVGVRIRGTERGQVPPDVDRVAVKVVRVPVLHVQAEAQSRLQRADMVSSYNFMVSAAKARVAGRAVRNMETRQSFMGYEHHAEHRHMDLDSSPTHTFLACARTRAPRDPSHPQVRNQLLGAPFSLPLLVVTELLPSGMRPWAGDYADGWDAYGVLPMDGLPMPRE